MKFECLHCGNIQLFEQRSYATGICTSMYNGDGTFFDASELHQGLKYRENKYMVCNDCGKKVHFALDQLINQKEKWEMGKDSEDFGGSWSQVYKNKCECGNEIEVSTQPDEYPEYTTFVFVKCSCGKSVKFELPVN